MDLDKYESKARKSGKGVGKKQGMNKRLYTKRYKFKLGDKVKISYLKKNNLIENTLKGGLSLREK